MLLEINQEDLIGVDWASPLHIVETANADATLKPFSEIQEIFENMMFVQYETQAADVLDYTFEIDKVALSLQRIAEQNSYENGLLVPVWNFYGKGVIKNDDNSISMMDTDGIAGDESVMSINAIDGTIIDIEKGY